MSVTPYRLTMEWVPMSREWITSMLEDGGKWQSVLRACPKYQRGEPTHYYLIRIAPGEKGCRLSWVENDEETFHGDKPEPFIYCLQHADYHKSYRCWYGDGKPAESAQSA